MDTTTIIYIVFSILVILCLWIYATRVEMRNNRFQTDNTIKSNIIQEYEATFKELMEINERLELMFKTKSRPVSAYIANNNDDKKKYCPISTYKSEREASRATKVSRYSVDKSLNKKVFVQSKNGVRYIFFPSNINPNKNK